MTEANDQIPEELQGMADSYHLMGRLLAENEEFKARVETAERSAEMLDRENADLRREIKRANSERDHFSRAFTALSAQLDSVAAGLVTAITQARVQSYGGRRPMTDIEKLAPVPDAEVPRFLRRPVEEGQPHMVADLEEVAERMRVIEAGRHQNGSTPHPINLDELAASIAGPVDRQ
jgi:negative regulator of sigma E activity